MAIQDCRMVKIPLVENQKGRLLVVEQSKQVLFQIKRVYYMYTMKEGTVRGGHAHMNSENVLIPLRGSFTLAVDDSMGKKEFLLNDPAFGVYVAPKTWLELKGFSPDSIVLVLSSEVYNEQESISDYELFKKTMQRQFNESVDC